MGKQTLSDYNVCQCDLDKKTALDQWKNMFEYDAFENSLLYVNIEKYGEDFLQDNKFSISNLKNIYVDIVRKEEMLSMLEVFREQEKSLKELTPYTNGLWKKKPKFEFHISSLCYDKKQNKFWITNHPSHGWSFGCTQITQNTNYFEYVSQIYLKKYGLQIQIDNSNHILSFYSVNRDATSEIILGVVILVTEVEEKEQISGIDAQWITYEETKKLQGNKLVNFDQIVNKAQNCVAEIAAI